MLYIFNRTTVNSFAHSFIIFYAPWCGHCKKAKPDFTELAANFSSDSKYFFGAVNCDADKTFCRSKDVKGFPTFFYYKYGDGLQYRGINDFEHFYEFLQDPEKALDPARDWEDIDGAEHIKKVTSFVDINSESRLNDHSLLFLFSSCKYFTFYDYKVLILTILQFKGCVECPSRKIEYAKAAKELTKLGIKHNLMAMNLDFYPDMAETLKVGPPPTCKWEIKFLVT